MKNERSSNSTHKSKKQPRLTPPDLEKLKVQKSQPKDSEKNSEIQAKKSKDKQKKSLFFNKNSELEKLKKELKEIKNSYAYLQAEFINFKRIQKKEREQSIKYASFPFLQDFLFNVLNDFNRAMEKEWRNSDFEDFKSGIEILHSKIIKILKQYGVKEINPKGETFNPHFHEVMSLGQDKNLPEQTILQVCKKGYSLHDRLVQPAQVIVNQFSENKTNLEPEKLNSKQEEE